MDYIVRRMALENNKPPPGLTKLHHCCSLWRVTAQRLGQTAALETRQELARVRVYLPAPRYSTISA